LGTFVPLIGLIQAGWQAMADRHTYLPSVGIAVMLSWGIPLFFKREDIRKKILFPAGIATIAILAILARQQCGYWKNSIELWNHTVQVTKNNAMAHFYLGVAYADLGQYQRAIEDYNETIRLRPDYAYAYYNRGNVYSSLNQHQRAIEDYNEVISSSPYLLAYLNRGNAYAKLGQYQRAIEDYNEAIRIKPDYADAYINKVIVYLLQGNKELGCRDAQKACELENCTILEEAKSKGYCR
jgi:tetratricopeptide (TPR) repeat protein